jgi:hypothetical protein
MGRPWQFLYIQRSCTTWDNKSGELKVLELVGPSPDEEFSCRMILSINIKNYRPAREARDKERWRWRAFDHSASSEDAEIRVPTAGNDENLQVQLEVRNFRSAVSTMEYIQ